jgi:hypothetical protein
LNSSSSTLLPSLFLNNSRISPALSLVCRILKLIFYRQKELMHLQITLEENFYLDSTLNLLRINSEIPFRFSSPKT